MSMIVSQSKSAMTRISGFLSNRRSIKKGTRVFSITVAASLFPINRNVTDCNTISSSSCFSVMISYNEEMTRDFAKTS
eukprot:20762_4